MWRLILILHDKTVLTSRELHADGVKQRELFWEGSPYPQPLYPTSATPLPRIRRVPMKLIQWFLLLLKRLVSSPNRALWWIWAFVRSCSSSQRPKKGDEDRRSTECRPAKSPPTVICASRSPSPLTPIAGDGTPIVSPTPISIQVRQPTILNLADIDYETHEDSLDEHPEHATIFVYRGVPGGARAENRNSTSDDAFHAAVQLQRKRRRNEVVKSHGQGPVNHSSRWRATPV